MDRARIARLVVLTAIVVQVVGCGDDDRPILVDSGPRDGGSGDAGPPTDGGGMDAGPMGTDAGPGVDAGPDVDAGDVDAGPMGTDAGPDTDAGPMGTDAGPATDAGPSPDELASAQIVAARAALDGVTDLAIDGAYVTYLKPAVGGATGEPAGFFVQALPTGPALYVDVDPTTLTPVPARGDRVSFHVTRMATAAMQRRASGVSTWMVLASGIDLTPLVQDLSAATDVVSGVDGYESELNTMTATISGPFVGASAGHVAAPITTAGYPTGDANLRMRLPITVRDSLDLVMGCIVDIGPTPLWRFAAQAQPSGWVDADISVTSCPAPRVVSAVALSATTVSVTFDRNIDPATVMAGGAQFVITGSGGLAVSAAVASGARTVTLTTATQTMAASYTVTVASTVHDTIGTGIDPAANAATFTGFGAAGPGRLVINEVDYDNVGTDSAEFIELYNGTAAAVPLGNLAVVFVNGTTSAEYSRVALTGSLPAGGYALVANMSVVTAAPGGVLTFMFADNSLQNGGPDGVALIDTVALTILDALSYEGAMTAVTITGIAGTPSLVEGTALAATTADSNTAQGALCRIPNGADSDNAMADWFFSTMPTPGAANVP